MTMTVRHVALLVATIAQLANGSDLLLCNSTTTSANASGIFPFSVDYPVANNSNQAGSTIQNVPDPAWALTVDQSRGQLQQTLWFDSAGQNYSDDLSLGYDVCAFALGNLPRNTVELGQDDPGDCSGMLTTECREALLTGISNSAVQLTSYASPPPYSNLSAGVMSSLCGLILDTLAEDGKPYPRVCAQDFGYSYSTSDTAAYNRQISTSVLAMTGYNDTLLNNYPCALSGQGRSFRPVVSTSEGAGTENYDTYARSVMPVISTWFTVANVERTSSTSFASVDMRCLRTREWGVGSRVSPALPAGTPYSSGKGLSGGVIAGIVVGIVVVVGLVGVGLWVWRRRAKKRVEEGKLGDASEGGHEMGGGDVHELKEGDRKLELGGSAVHEKLGDTRRGTELDSGAIHELKGSSKPAELSA